MTVRTAWIGETEFLHIEDVIAIPIHRIRKFDFKISNGGASEDSVQIVTDDPDEEIIFAFDNCQAIKDFLNEAIT